MIDPSQANKRRRQMNDAAWKARQKSQQFLRKAQFDIYMKQGLPMEEAARRVGVKIPFGRFFTKYDIMKKIETGK